MTASTIKPIETHYAGCRFRSRLEARYAVFLDALGLRWEYEPEGFDLPSGAYLPDFKVYHSNGGHGYCWLEVKPSIPTDHALHDELACHEVRLARELSRVTRVAVVIGSYSSFEALRDNYLLIVNDKTWFRFEYPRYEHEPGSGSGYQHFVTQYWDRVGVVLSEALSMPTAEDQERWMPENLSFISFEECASTLYKAAVAALSARFEHGESGAPRR